jgi:hypothetical protein
LQIGSVVRVSDQWGMRWKKDFLAGMKNFRPAAWMTETSDGEGPSLPPPYKYYPAKAGMQSVIYNLGLITAQSSSIWNRTSKTAKSYTISRLLKL